MPLSRGRMRERKRLDRLVKPRLTVVKPNPYLEAHIRNYPEGFLDGTYRKDYDPEYDSYINPLLRGRVPMPNRPDGRYNKE